MSEQTKKRKRPPIFHTSVDVDVDVFPHQLEEAGWRYVGDDPQYAPIAPRDVYLDAIRGWHDEEHPHPWMWCTEEPCVRVRNVVDEWRELAS